MVLSICEEVQGIGGMLAAGVKWMQSYSYENWEIFSSFHFDRCFFFIFLRQQYKQIFFSAEREEKKLEKLLSYNFFYAI